MIWHIFQKSLWDKTEKVERKKNLNVQKLTFDTNLDTFITCTVPISVLIQRHIYEGSNSAESKHRRAATKAKWNILHYHQGSPLRLKSSALPSFRGSAQLQNVLPRDCVHTCKCAHARPSTCTHTHTQQNQRRNKIRKRGEETRFRMSLSVFYCDIILFCVPPPWQGTGRLEQQSECDVTFWWGLYPARLLLICKLT